MSFFISIWGKGLVFVQSGSVAQEDGYFDFEKFRSNSSAEVILMISAKICHPWFQPNAIRMETDRLSPLFGQIKTKGCEVNTCVIQRTVDKTVKTFSLQLESQRNKISNPRKEEPGKTTENHPESVDTGNDEVFYVKLVHKDEESGATMAEKDVNFLLLFVLRKGVRCSL